MSERLRDGAAYEPVVYAHYLLAADRSPLNFDGDARERFVTDVARFGDSGIQLCLKTLGTLRPTWNDALQDVAHNRHTYWHKEETPLQSLTRVRYGFTAVVNQLYVRGSMVPPLHHLDTDVLQHNRPAASR